jgi:hypothetical protein
METTKSRTAAKASRTYTTFDEFEKATFPKARRERLQKEAKDDPRDVIANSVLAVLRRHSASSRRS